MKKLVLLFAALLVAGCGEKSSSEVSDSTGESAEASADTAKPIPAESPSEEPSDTPNSLSDADVERLLKEAVGLESLEERGGLIHQDDTPYSGWVKAMHNSEQVAILAQAKDGKPDGPHTSWYENGQKSSEGTYKNGVDDGLLTEWHENGQKSSERTFKNGEEVSGKYWNSRGEEVEGYLEAFE